MVFSSFLLYQMCTIMNMVHPHIQISPESIKIYQKFTLCNIQIIPMIVEICKICTLWGGIWPEGRRGFYSCPSQSLLLSPSSAHYAYSWLSHSPPLLYIMQVWFTKGQFYIFLLLRFCLPLSPSPPEQNSVFAPQWFTLHV